MACPPPDSLRRTRAQNGQNRRLDDAREAPWARKPPTVRQNRRSRWEARTKLSHSGYAEPPFCRQAVDFGHFGTREASARAGWQSGEAGRQPDAGGGRAARETGGGRMRGRAARTAGGGGRRSAWQEEEQQVIAVTRRRQGNARGQPEHLRVVAIEGGDHGVERGYGPVRGRGPFVIAQLSGTGKGARVQRGVALDGPRRASGRVRLGKGRPVEPAILDEIVVHAVAAARLCQQVVEVARVGRHVDAIDEGRMPPGRERGLALRGEREERRAHLG